METTTTIQATKILSLQQLNDTVTLTMSAFDVLRITEILTKIRDLAYDNKSTPGGDYIGTAIWALKQKAKEQPDENTSKELKKITIELQEKCIDAMEIIGELKTLLHEQREFSEVVVEEIEQYQLVF